MYYANSMQIFKLVEAARLTCLFFVSPREMSAPSVPETMNWEGHLSLQEHCLLSVCQGLPLEIVGQGAGNCSLVSVAECPLVVF